MYASVRRYRAAQDEVDALMHRIDEEFAEQISGQPGFCSYQAIDCGGGMVITVTCFREAEDADRSAEAAARWISESLSDFEIERLDASAGEVQVSRAVSEVLQPAHH